MAASNHVPAANQAVFLSYASEDSSPAARICVSLREAGIEVWFDQTELRGGDAWDLQIRRQVRDCALFVPIISQHTQQRAEGYFRLEWDLADQRSHMIARSKAFIVPVVVDGTPDAGAEVPDSFLKVQWTRLPAGAIPPAFCARIATLLGGTNGSGAAVVGAGPVRPVAIPQPVLRRASLLAAGLLLVALFGWQLWRLQAPHSGARPVAHLSSAAIPAVEVAPAKSIAVLPFVNMSKDKEQDYFADGLSEELIDHLAHNPGLKVIARTSSFAFKGRNEDIRSIAATLGVANLLEGSVRKAGMELRITAQLIRAVDGVHLWSQTYERKLTDIFKIQDEISTTVAKALNVVMGAATRPAVPGPSNIEAYNLLLRGNHFRELKNEADTARAVELYREAIKLDPTYALAWCRLSDAYAQQADYGWSPRAAGYALARHAAEYAVQLAPNLAATHITLGWVHFGIDWDWESARAEFERARALDPNDSKVARGLARVTNTIYGRLEDEIARRREELARNPLDTEQLEQLAYLLLSSGHLEESVAMFRSVLQLNPNLAGGPSGLAITLLSIGRFDEALAEANRDVDDGYRMGVLPIIYWAQRRKAESDIALKRFERRYGESAPYLAAQIHAYRGETDAAFLWLERAFRQRETDLVLVRSDPLLRGLRQDPRYAMLLVKLKLQDH